MCVSVCVSALCSYVCSGLFLVPKEARAQPLILDSPFSPLSLLFLSSFLDVPQRKERVKLFLFFLV